MSTAEELYDYNEVTGDFDRDCDRMALDPKYSLAFLIMDAADRAIAALCADRDEWEWVARYAAQILSDEVYGHQGSGPTIDGIRERYAQLHSNTNDVSVQTNVTNADKEGENNDNQAG